MLPDHDGVEVLRRLRASGATAPVIFLSARTQTSDRVRGLTAGGDDYVAKPFALEELVARVGVVLRRARASRRSWSRSSAPAPQGRRRRTTPDPHRARIGYCLREPSPAR